MDALARRQGPRLWAAVEPTLDEEDFALSPRIRALAGLVALELMEVEPARRRAFAAEHMVPLGEGRDSGDWAFQVLAAYGMRE